MKIEDSVCRLAHITAGVIAGAAIRLSGGWILTLCITAGFILYEVIEMIAIQKTVAWKDSAHEEIAEFLLGMCLITFAMVMSNGN